MEEPRHKQRIEEWVYEQIGKGVFTFTLEQMEAEFSSISRKSIIVALSRLAKKGRVLSLHRGFYLIVYPQYQSKGIIPPSYFIDKLMKSLNRPYYVGLLNAAESYGAAHQKPQEFFVFTNRPPLRSLVKKGVKVNFIGINEIQGDQLQERKTPFGYFKLSSPILTALNLIEYGNHIGGLNRAATILNELSDEMKETDFTQNLIASSSLPTLQRLGFILESVVNKPELSQSLYLALKESKLKMGKVKLDSGGETKGFPISEKWNLIINYEIEIDE